MEALWRAGGPLADFPAVALLTLIQGAIRGLTGISVKQAISLSVRRALGYGPA